MSFIGKPGNYMRMLERIGTQHPSKRKLNLERAWQTIQAPSPNTYVRTLPAAHRSIQNTSRTLNILRINIDALFLKQGQATVPREALSLWSAGCDPGCSCPFDSIAQWRGGRHVCGQSGSWPSDSFGNSGSPEASNSAIQ